LRHPTVFHFLLRGVRTAIALPPPRRMPRTLAPTPYRGRFLCAGDVHAAAALVDGPGRRYLLVGRFAGKRTERQHGFSLPAHHFHWRRYRTTFFFLPQTRPFSRGGSALAAGWLLPRGRWATVERERRATPLPGALRWRQTGVGALLTVARRTTAIAFVHPSPLLYMPHACVRRLRL